MKFSFISSACVAALAGLLTTVAACGGGGSSNGATGPVAPTPAPPPAAPAQASFEVAVTNLTLRQPLSPPAIIFHDASYQVFEDGVVASDELEILAEDGDPQPLLDDAAAAAGFISAGTPGGPIGPLQVRDTETFTFDESELADLRLTMLTMLVHTNDAFTGLNGTDLSGMAVGERRVFNGPTWDAGTEANSENAATIPGPDFGGVGFDAVRDDLFDRVRFHQGVVTSASVESGQADSALVETHRFDNPTSRLVITRIE